MEKGVHCCYEAHSFVSGYPLARHITLRTETILYINLSIIKKNTTEFYYSLCGANIIYAMTTVIRLCTHIQSKQASDAYIFEKVDAYTQYTR